MDSAGTGKSLLLKEIVARLRKIHPPGSVYVTASTGIAACQVGGITLHTFAGVGLAKYKAQSLVFKVMKVPPIRMMMKMMMGDDDSGDLATLGLSFNSFTQHQPSGSSCGETVAQGESDCD